MAEVSLLKWRMPLNLTDKESTSVVNIDSGDGLVTGALKHQYITWANVDPRSISTSGAAFTNMD